MHPRLLFTLALTLFPLAAAAQETTRLENPLGNIQIWELFARVAGGLNFATGALALLFILLGGYRILSAAGNSEKFETGKKMIVYAFIGMVLTVGSYALLSITIGVLSGPGGPAGFANSAVLVDPLNLRDGIRSAVEVLYGERILKFLLGGLGGLTVLMFVYAGLLWLTAAGNEERISSAKKTLSYALIGLIVVLGSYIFTSFAYAPFYWLLAGR